jgi:fructoselysine-6-P-deglycase FrlB-like protein
MYVLASGPLTPLAYKVALTVVMENIRIGGTFCDAMEFRHGPAEALERTQLDAIVLLGIHPLLTPLVLNSIPQWFIVYSAILRGITDLDARVFMGHGVLTDAPWP